MADALASLAATLALGAEEVMTILVCSHWVILLDDEDLEEDVNAIWALETDEEDWRQPIIEYLEHGKLPSDPRHKQKYGGEVHVFCIITERFIDGLIMAFGYDAWILKRQSKQWRRLS